MSINLKLGIFFTIFLMFIIGFSFALQEKLAKVCSPADGDSKIKCALQCLFFPKYKTGVCGNDGFCYCETKYSK